MSAYKQLLSYSTEAANGYLRLGLKSRQDIDGQSPIVVGLLAASSLDFLTTWFALMRLGLGVLFIA